MQAVYLFTNGDTTTRLAKPLEVHGYGCGVIELTGKVVIPKRLIRNNKKSQSPPQNTNVPKETTTSPPEEEEETTPPPNNPTRTIPPHDETFMDQPITQPIPAPPLQDDEEEEGFTENLFLCCDIIEESYIGKKKMPILRYLKRKNGNLVNTINNVIWLKVMRPTISTIRLYIADEYGKILSLPRNKLNCTLLFVPAPEQ